MRKFIIDTDTASDDAVALLMALLDESVSVEAITTVCGNAPLRQATLNALMTVEVAGTIPAPPVYQGCEKPLMRPLVTAEKVHGDDGMGDCGLIHPATAPAAGHAADVLCRLAAESPGTYELVALGPVTNIALAIMKDPAAMRGIKHIYTMGTGGFGPGNTTPVAEFNTYVDAEAYAVMLNSGIPVTIIGFDLCTGAAALQKGEIENLLQSGKPLAKFAVDCNKTLLDYNLERSGEHIIDLPDPVAMAVALWPDIVLDARDCYCHVCTAEEETYGQMIPYSQADCFAIHNPQADLPPNARVIKAIDPALFKQRLVGLLTR